MPTPDSEKIVYDHLRKNLHKDYSIYPSCRFLKINDREQIQEAEYDFTIFHPEYGIVVVEVKGGEVSFDGNKWYSIDVNGEKHKIKDPFQQAQDAARWFMDRIKEQDIFRDAPMPVPVAFAVFFPNILWDDTMPLPPNAIREAILDSESFDDIEESLIKVFGYFKRPNHKGISAKHEITILKTRVLAPQCSVFSTIKSTINFERQQFARVTEDQLRILDMLEHRKRVAVKGYAGTGKTVLAMQKARMLSVEGLEVTLICFNEPLAEAIRNAIGENTVVKHFHRHCQDICESAGISFPIPKEEDEKRFFWEQEAPEKMLEAVNVTGLKYDAVIVDEGQDFREHWWLPVEGMVKDDGYFYIFYDPNQMIYQDEMVLPCDDSGLVLNVNCRNTKKIGEVVCRLGEVHMKWPSSAAEGETPAFISCKNQEEQYQKICEKVKTLLDTGKLEPNDIVILSTRSRKNSCCAAYDYVSGIQLTEDLIKKENRIRISSLHRFKGLEADIVLLCDIDEKTPAKNLYVAASRARHRAYFFHHPRWEI